MKKELLAYEKRGTAVDIPVWDGKVGSLGGGH